MIICATGHRPNKLGGYSKDIYVCLIKLAYEYLAVQKPDAVISGMALGWDQAWADAALLLGIPVHAAIPFEGQESQWLELTHPSPACNTAPNSAQSSKYGL